MLFLVPRLLRPNEYLMRWLAMTDPRPLLRKSNPSCPLSNPLLRQSLCLLSFREALKIWKICLFLPHPPIGMLSPSAVPPLDTEEEAMLNPLLHTLEKQGVLKKQLLCLYVPCGHHMRMGFSSLPCLFPLATYTIKRPKTPLAQQNHKLLLTF